RTFCRRVSFFTDPASSPVSPLSLHDALPISRPDGLHRLVVVHELPPELVVRLELVDHLLADVDLTGEIRTRPFVLIDDRNLDVVRVTVRVPERDDVDPGVEGRQHEQADDDRPRLRCPTNTREVTTKHLEGVAHTHSSRDARAKSLQIAQLIDGRVIHRSPDRYAIRSQATPRPPG